LMHTQVKPAEEPDLIVSNQKVLGFHLIVNLSTRVLLLFFLSLVFYWVKRLISIHVVIISHCIYKILFLLLLKKMSFLDIRRNKLWSFLSERFYQRLYFKYMFISVSYFTLL
jgi:hypothetical protein